MAEDLKLNILISALDLATKDIEGVNSKVKELGETLTRSEFSTAGAGMERLGAAVKEATQPMADTAKTALALGAAISGIASLLAGRVYQSSVAYESATADLAKVMDGGAESAQAYGQQLNILASQYGQNGQSLLGAMTNFVQAGYSAGEAFSLVEESVKLMIAGELSAAESSANLVSILKGFNAPASDAGRAVDILNEVSNKYATDVKQLADGMAGVSPVARQMGFSMEETAALLTPVIEVYQSGSEAADALKTGLQKLTDNAKPVVDALASIGISQTTANGTLRSGKEIFLDVAQAFTTLDDNTKQYLTSQLVGIEQAGRMSTVLSDMGKYLDITATGMTAAGSAAHEVEVRLQTAAVQAARAEESFRQLSVTLGNQFKPEIAALIGSTGELASAFDRAVKAGDLNPLLNVIKPQIAAVEGLFTAMAGNLEETLSKLDWAPLVNGLRAVSGELGEAFAALTEGVDLTTVDGLRTVLQGVVNILGDLAQWIGGVLDGLEPMMDALNALFGVVSQGYPDLARLIGQMEGLALSVNQVIPVIASIGSTIFGAIGAVVEFVAKVGLLIGALRLLSAAGVPLGAILSTLGSGFSALLPTLGMLILRFSGLGAVMGTLAAGFVLVKSYDLGSWLRETGLASLYAAEQGTLAAKAFDLLATAAEAAQLHLSEIDAKIADKLKAISEQTGVAVTSMKDLEKAVKDGVIVFDEASGTWVKATQAVEDFTAANQAMIDQSDQSLAIAAALTDQFARLGLSYNKATGEVGGHQDKLNTLGQTQLHAVDAAERLSRAIAQEGALRVTHLRNLAQEAAARGHTIAATHLDTDARQAEIATLKQLIISKQAEIVAAQEELAAKQATAAAARDNKAAAQEAVAVAAATVATKQLEVQALQESARAATEEADAVRRSNAARREGANGLDRLRGELGGLGGELDDASEATDRNQSVTRSWAESMALAARWTGVAIDSLGEYASEAEKAYAAAHQANQATTDFMNGLIYNGRSMGPVMASIGDGFKRIAKEEVEAAVQAATLARAYDTMQATAADLQAEFDRGDLGLSAYASRLQGLITANHALGQEKLQPLRDALRDAKEQMQDFTDSARDGLRELQIEWANLNNNQAEAENLEYQRDRLELEAQLTEAQRNGNQAALAALQAQLTLLARIHEKKLADLKTEQKAAAQVPSSTASGASTPAVPTGAGGGAAAMTGSRASVPGTGSGGMSAPVGGAGTTVNINVSGMFDAGDRAAMTNLTRKIKPYFDDMARRGA